MKTNSQPLQYVPCFALGRSDQAFLLETLSGSNAYHIVPDSFSPLRLRLLGICPPSSIKRALLTYFSSDDTSVAILETHDGQMNKGHNPAARNATLHYHQKVTSDNREHRGIHPIVSLESHGANLAKLVNDALQHLPSFAKEDEQGTTKGISVVQNEGIMGKRKPDFITVTRGPGMRGNLAVGLDTAKGLAVAWQVPLVGVHHMQAHAMTPRLVSALENTQGARKNPEFPFLSLLVSGGHTILVDSQSLTEHSIIASTVDIAIGDALDKVARMILPLDLLARSSDTMYGRLLEQFAFPNGAADYNYQALQHRGDLLNHHTLMGQKLMLPFADTRAPKFSFVGMQSTIERILDAKRSKEMTSSERVEGARAIFRLFFEHLADRIVLALQDEPRLQDVKTLVVSGGVASNNYLKTVLKSLLDVRGFGKVRIVYPPPSLCTDNAAMVAWAGVEMFEAGWSSDLSCGALRKWSMDSGGKNDGILGVGGWTRNRPIRYESNRSTIL